MARDKESPPGTDTPTDSVPADGAFDMRRRTFLKLGGATLSAVTLPELLASCDGDEAQSRLLKDVSIVDRDPTFWVDVYRKEDFVALRVGFVNMELDRSGSRLVRDPRTGLSEKAIIVVSHEPQHVLERAFQEDAANSDPPGGLPVASRLSGRSRVAFLVPDDVDELPFDSSALLKAFREYEMAVALNALPPPKPPVIIRPFPLPGGILDVGTINPGNLGNLNTRASVLQTNTNQARVDTDFIASAERAGSVQTIRATQSARTIGRLTGLDVGIGPVVDINPDLIQLLPTKPVRPTARQTSLELPYRLEISPNRFGAWAHAWKPVKSILNDRVELWHSRLAVRGKDGQPYEGESYLRAVRALWSRDKWFDPDQPPIAGDPTTDPGAEEPFRASLMPRDRIRIVHQSSNYTMSGNVGPYKPRAIDVNRLMLTSLGGWLDSRADFGDDAILDLTLWEHKATMGRDHYVKVVYSGYLYPFGHRAVLVTVTERKFDNEADPKKPNPPHTAYLRRRQFLVVKQPVMTYSTGRGLPQLGPTLRQLPFSVIHVKTLVTPNLDAQGDPTPPGSDPPPPPVSFTPKVNLQLFRFACEAIDEANNVHKFDTPVVWVQGNANSGVSAATLAQAEAAWNAVAGGARCDFSGQRVMFAPFNKTDDTTFETAAITFGDYQILSGERSASGYEAPFVPFIEKAELAVEAVRALSGNGAAPAFKYHDAYKASGFSASGNKGEVLFQLADMATPVGANFSKGSDKTGGFVAPSVNITGLSRLSGPVGGSAASLASDVAAGGFNPKEFFGGIEALLFGTINLFDIIQPLTDLIGEGLDRAPKFITQSLSAAEALLEDALKMYEELKNTESALTSAGNDVVANLKKLTDDILAKQSGAIAGDVSALKTSLENLPNALDGAPGASLTDGLRKDLKRRAKQLASILGPELTAGIVAFIEAQEAIKEQRVRLEWRPKIKAWPSLSDPNPWNDVPKIFEPLDENNALILAAEIRAKASKGKPAGADLLCSLESFNLNLIGKDVATSFVKLKFKRIQFIVEAGKKPDIVVDFDGIEFVGVLSFIEKIKQFIPLDGFSDPPNLEVNEQGITASFGLSLPDVAVGMFSLTNMSLNAGFRVPFIGDPLTVSFSFCTRENPFCLTVCMIGGGGFFGITLAPTGIYLIEAAFEAGAQLALDFGVASGSVSIMLGVYFKMVEQSCELTGYLRIRGEVDVLGLISASIELYLELRYESASGKLIGRASLEICVEILFLSFTVTVTCERKFQGSNDDPTFAELMAPDEVADFYPWDEYVDAFAPQ